MANAYLRLLFRHKRVVVGTVLVSAGLFYYVQQQRQREKLVADARRRRQQQLQQQANAEQQQDNAESSVAAAETSTAAVVAAAATSSSAAKDRKRVGVNAEFLQQLRKLLHICIPSVYSKEAGLLVTLAVVLLGRTWLDIWFSAFNGEVVKAIVMRDRNTFIRKAVIEFGLMMWPMSVINSMLKLTINSLSISFRARLTKYAHDQYLRDLTFYKVTNLDNRINNADQLLTQDIDKFAENLSHLYSDLAKPIVDIILFAFKLGQALGTSAPFYMMGYFVLSGSILRAISPPFGKYTAQEQKLEGDFRFHHSRIITHAEEIAFFGGSEREKTLVNSSFQAISKHVSRVFQLRFANGVIDSILVKYCATMTAYFLLSRPVFYPKLATEHMGALSEDPTQIIEDYSRNSGYLVKLSQAVGSLMMEARTLSQFAGYTSRVAELFEVLEDVNQGRYERIMMTEQKEGARNTEEPRSSVIDTRLLKGTIDEQDYIIRFDRVPVVTPNGDVLIKELSFEVRSGMNLLITGPNGSGKSSLFRILGSLWPLFEGHVTKPSFQKLFYVPQRPYLALGSLRDQIIYPQSRAEVAALGVTDDDLLEILKSVRLEYLVTREGGWDATSDWADVLSGGEKQRVAMARLFYHRPQFAILDECTSAVSVDVEGEMYTHARTLGITLFTVSHRQSLWKYHEYLLKFDGNGGYEFKPLAQGENAFAFKPRESYAGLSKQELNDRIALKTQEYQHEMDELRKALDLH